MQNLYFKVSDSGEGAEGEFIWGEERRSLFEKFYQASEKLISGNIQKSLNQLKSIIKKDPEFIDAYNTIGAHFLEKGNPRKALEYYSKGYQIGMRVIPKGFDGKIVWLQLDNRPFLRALHGLGLSYIDLFQRDKAIELFERILVYNPNDNQGVRYIIGDLYLTNKNFQAADKYFSDNLDYPPYRYSYGFSLFKQRRYIESIVQFWLGFYENIYILEHILDHYPIIRYDCAHCSNLEMPETAKEYYSENLYLWSIDKDVKSFVRMIYESFSVHLGIQAIFERKKYLSAILTDSAEKIQLRKELIDNIKKLKEMVTKEAATRIYRDLDQKFFGK